MNLSNYNCCCECGYYAHKMTLERNMGLCDSCVTWLTPDPAAAPNHTPTFQPVKPTC